MEMIIFILLLQQPMLVYSQWYLGEEKELTSDDTEDLSTPIPATSPIECILECQRKLRGGYYMEDTNQCFCLKSEMQKIYSKQNIDGILYRQEKVSFFQK